MKFIQRRYPFAANVNILGNGETTKKIGIKASSGSIVSIEGKEFIIGDSETLEFFSIEDVSNIHFTQNNNNAIVQIILN